MKITLIGKEQLNDTNIADKINKLVTVFFSRDLYILPQDYIERTKAIILEVLRVKYPYFSDKQLMDQFLPIAFARWYPGQNKPSGYVSIYSPFSNKRLAPLLEEFTKVTDIIPREDEVQMLPIRLPDYTFDGDYEEQIRIYPTELNLVPVILHFQTRENTNHEAKRIVKI